MSVRREDLVYLLTRPEPESAIDRATREARAEIARRATLMRQTYHAFAWDDRMSGWITRRRCPHWLLGMALETALLALIVVAMLLLPVWLP